VPPLLLRAFRPQILVSQHGCDTHWLDPLANLELTVDGQRTAHAAIHQLAHQTAGGRRLLTGGGGYELVQVIPATGPICSPKPQAIMATRREVWPEHGMFPMP
jgi:acetoin utilization protein AcuC